MNVKTLSLVAAIAATFASNAALAADAYVSNQNMPQAVIVRSTPVAPVAVAAQNEYQLNQIPAATRAPFEVTRAQVRAEAIEARRLGLIPVGDAPLPEPTLAQLERVHLAGLAAVNHIVAGK